MPTKVLHDAFLHFLLHVQKYVRHANTIQFQKDKPVAINRAEQAYDAMNAAHDKYDKELVMMLLAKMNSSDLHMIGQIIGGFRCLEKDFLDPDCIKTLESLLLTFKGEQISMTDMVAEIENQLRTTVQGIQQLPNPYLWQIHQMCTCLSKSRPTLADESVTVNVVIDCHARVMTLPTGKTAMMCKSTLGVPVFVTMP
jgi:hypothetical protein